MLPISKIKHSCPPIAKIKFKPSMKHIGLLWSTWETATQKGIDYICVEMLRISGGGTQYRQLFGLISSSLKVHNIYAQTIEDYYTALGYRLSAEQAQSARLEFLSNLIGAVTGKYMSDLAMSGKVVTNIKIEVQRAKRTPETKNG